MMASFDMSLVQRGARLRRSPCFVAEQRHGPRGYTVTRRNGYRSHSAA